MNHWIVLLLSAGLITNISCQPKEQKEVIYVEDEKPKEVPPEPGVPGTDEKPSENLNEGDAKGSPQEEEKGQAGGSSAVPPKLPEDSGQEAAKESDTWELSEEEQRWQNAIQVRTEGVISGRIPLSKGELKFLKMKVKNRGSEKVQLSLDEQRKFFVIEPFYYYFYISRILVFQPIFLAAKFEVSSEGKPVEQNGQVHFELDAGQEVEVMASAEMRTDCQDYELAQRSAKNLSEYLGVLYGYTHEIHSVLRVIRSSKGSETAPPEVFIRFRDVNAKRPSELVMLNEIALNPGVIYDEPFRLFSRFAIDYYKFFLYRGGPTKG